MKKIFFAFIVGLASLNAMALSSSKIREHARFLSDRMAYELDLSPMQYDDVYEINYDFIRAVDNLMDDVVLGYIDAIDRYYDYLDYRNDDLRYVLSSRQYSQFLLDEYFFRPIYVSRSSWNFRIYNVYNNRSFFYYDRPSGYYSYIGSHARRYYSNGYYVSRYSASNRHQVVVKIRSSRDFDMHRRNDFGVNLRKRNEPARVNNYRNQNQSNRAQDPRYRSERQNVNSPSINNRVQANGRGNQSSSKANQSSKSNPGVVKSGHR